LSLTFNIQNSNTVYPLFFGEDLGLSDAFNITYPEILEADQKQRELFWPADEIDLTQDYADLQEMDASTYELFIRALSMQLTGDSVANGSIAMLFLPIVSNPQAKGLVSYWNDSESVHDRAYSLVVAQCFKDPNELLDRVRQDTIMIKRLTPILENFGKHNDMIRRMMNNDPTLTLKEKRITTIKTIVTLLALEGIMFLTSFATTFAICEAEQKCNGIAKLIGLIHDDEGGSHVRNNLIFLDIIRNQEKWPEWDECKDECKDILDLVMESEYTWASQLFDGCGSVVGFNTGLLKQYSNYLSKPLYDRLGLRWDFDVCTTNPFPWIDAYIKPDLLQVAAQEAQVTNYKVNASVDDTDGMMFDY